MDRFTNARKWIIHGIARRSQRPSPGRGWQAYTKVDTNTHTPQGSQVQAGRPEVRRVAFREESEKLAYTDAGAWWSQARAFTEFS